MSAAESLQAWIPQVQGQYINEDWNAENQGFGAQCWDLPANWSKYLGLPVISTDGAGRWPGWAGNMVDAFPQSPEIAAAYELIPPDQTVLPGDILVWDDSYPVWFPKTHTAVGIADKGPQLLCASQNSTPSQPDNPYPEWTTGPATIQHLPRRGLLGIIRPQQALAAQGTITSTDASGEDDFLMALSQTTQAGMAENSYLNLDSNARIEAQNRAILETLGQILPAVARMDTRLAENVDVQGRIEKNQALMLDSQAAAEKLAAQIGGK